MKSPLVRLSVAAACAAASASLFAQTTTAPRRATSSAAAGTHRAAAATPGCVAGPALSPKIPALPAGDCLHALYTVTRTPELKLDYVNPMVGPEVRALLGPPPVTFSLLFTDTKTGTGTLLQQGKFASMRYTGWMTDGTKFDSSDDHPDKAPLPFQYGAHRVIPGWDTGLEGMRVGGKRRLVIPYILAYGENGNPRGGIPPKSTLVFDVELVGVSDTDPTSRPVPPAGVPGVPPAAQPAAPPSTPPGAAAQPAGRLATPPVTSTTPATPLQPTGSTTPKQ